MRYYRYVAVLVLLLIASPGRAAGWAGWFAPPSAAGSRVLALEAPQLLTPGNGTSISLGQPIPLSWTAVPGAEGYRFEVNGNTATTTQTALVLPPIGMTVGSFSWRVQAYNTVDGNGPWSDPWVFHIVTPTPTPTPTPDDTPPPDLDVDANGNVDYEDAFVFLEQWQQPNAPSDYTGDGRLDQRDLLLFLKGWQSPGRLYPTPVPLLPPPLLLEPLNGSSINFLEIVYEEFNPDRGVDFSWTAVEGADSYHLRIQGPPGWSNLRDYVVRGIVGTHYKVSLPLRLDNRNDLGLYRWQVRGYSNALEGAGAFSRTYLFTVERNPPTPTPTPTPIPRSADIDQNGDVTVEDVFTFARVWQVSEMGQPALYDQYERADLDFSGQVDQSDLHLFLGSFVKRREETILTPVLLAPADGTRVPIAQTDPAVFQWKFQASENAAVYEYEIIPPPPYKLSSGFINDTSEAEYYLTRITRPAVIGEWQWRLRAYGPSGRVSLWSPQWSFVVTGN